MTAFVNIVVAERSNVLRVPLAALRYKPSGEVAPATGKTEVPKAGEKTVYRLDRERPSPVAVRIGIADGKFAEIAEGPLREGDGLIAEELEPRKGAEAPGGTTGGAFRVRMF